MEVIAIQKSTFNDLNKELDEMLRLTDRVSRAYSPIFNAEKWLDNQEVCLMLNITKRTLQTHKDRGLLPYSKLNRKNYYKLSDVLALLKHTEQINELKDGTA